MSFILEPWFIAVNLTVPVYLCCEQASNQLQSNLSLWGCPAKTSKVGNLKDYATDPQLKVHSGFRSRYASIKLTDLNR